MPYRNGEIVKWKVRIKRLRSLLGEDTSVENSQKVGKEIYKILNYKMYQKYFKEYDYETGMMLDEFLFIEDCKHLNQLLETFYDYCDSNLIWIDFE